MRTIGNMGTVVTIGTMENGKNQRKWAIGALKLNKYGFLRKISWKLRKKKYIYITPRDPLRDLKRNQIKNVMVASINYVNNEGGGG